MSSAVECKKHAKLAPLRGPPDPSAHPRAWRPPKRAGGERGCGDTPAHDPFGGGHALPASFHSAMARRGSVQSSPRSRRGRRRMERRRYVCSPSTDTRPSLSRSCASRATWRTTSSCVTAESLGQVQVLKLFRVESRAPSSRLLLSEVPRNDASPACPRRSCRRRHARSSSFSQGAPPWRPRACNTWSRVPSSTTARRCPKCWPRSTTSSKTSRPLAVTPA
mmetsp:Transcript_29618/g.67909  ORF Transcript_29618/g.67909 Transcript_29618/m.67909 type:complete len:221 (-) Transcript_29618:1307-1969(-)